MSAGRPSGRVSMAPIPRPNIPTGDQTVCHDIMATLFPSFPQRNVAPSSSAPSCANERPIGRADQSWNRNTSLASSWLPPQRQRLQPPFHWAGPHFGISGEVWFRRTKCHVSSPVRPGRGAAARKREGLHTRAEQKARQTRESSQCACAPPSPSGRLARADRVAAKLR